MLAASPAPSPAAPEALVPHGEPIPEAVLHTKRFLDGLGVVARFSRNAEALSCRDAARKRHRLGAVGIPLHDELKSWFGRYVDAEGRCRRVMVHCRGDEELDLAAVTALLRARELERLDADALADLGARYGTVNPFRADPIVHVFDRGLCERRGVPGTVMTNAGELTWAVELYADELVHAMGDALVAPVVTGGTPTAGPIAILAAGGAAGRAVWAHAEDGVRERLGADWQGDVSLPDMAVRAVPSLAVAADPQYRAAAWEGLHAAVGALGAAGFGTLALASPAAHALLPELRALCQGRGLRLLTLHDVGDAFMDEEGVAEADVLGLDGTWTSGRRHGPSARTEELLRALVARVQREGPSEAARQQLRDVLGRTSRAHVVLGEPELALLVQTQRRPGRSGRVLVDPFALLGRALAFR